MFEKIDLFNLAGLMARHAAERQRLTADNIANASTPDFKARDLKPFAEQLAALTDQGLTADAIATPTFETVETRLPGGPKPNGNTVSLQNELLNSAEAASQHETAVLIYGKAIDIMRASVGGRR